MARRVINGRGPAWLSATGVFWEGVRAGGGQEEFRGSRLVPALEPPEDHRTVGVGRDIRRSSGPAPKNAPWEICTGSLPKQKARGLLGACPWVISRAVWQFAQCWGPSSAGKPISPLRAAPPSSPQARQRVPGSALELGTGSPLSQLGAGCRHLAPFPAGTPAPCSLFCFGGTGTPRRDSSCGAGTGKVPGTPSPAEAAPFWGREELAGSGGDLRCLLLLALLLPGSF